jgi:hypothetical protein
MEVYAAIGGFLMVFDPFEGVFERRLLTSAVGNYILASRSLLFPLSISRSLLCHAIFQIFSRHGTPAQAW